MSRSDTYLFWLRATLWVTEFYHTKFSSYVLKCSMVPWSMLVRPLYHNQYRWRNDAILDGLNALHSPLQLSVWICYRILQCISPICWARSSFTRLICSNAIYFHCICISSTEFWSFTEIRGVVFSISYCFFTCVTDFRVYS